MESEVNDIGNAQTGLCATQTPIMEVKDLVVEFTQRHAQNLRAVNRASFNLYPGKTLALVGESGSGKSSVIKALGRLIKVNSGGIILNGKPIKGRWHMLDYRQQVQLVFQDPFASLNPVYTVYHHLARPLLLHGQANKSNVRSKVEELLEKVKLTPASEIADKHPHELSGGQRQRVAIARAIAPKPKILLADEPVSMLDVSIRLEILNLLDELREKENLAILYVTHDLATARHFSSSMIVMYKGTIVESGNTDVMILNPHHPYTQLLANSSPKKSVAKEQLVKERDERLRTKKGVDVKIMQFKTNGCSFISRCLYAKEVCMTPPPEFTINADSTRVKCWLYQDE